MCRGSYYPRPALYRRWLRRFDEVGMPDGFRYRKSFFEGWMHFFVKRLILNKSFFDMPCDIGWFPLFSRPDGGLMVP
jgi:hypothetical protein